MISFINSQSSNSQKTYDATNKKMEKKLLKFLDTLKPGICSNIILNKTKTNLFSPKLIGRLLPQGTFSTPIQAFEYLYGIFCQIQGLLVRTNSVQSTELKQITFDQNKYLCGAEIILVLAPKNISLTFFAFVAFDSQFRICGYDAQVRNNGLTFDDPSSTDAATIQGLCQGIQQICKGRYQQYSNRSDCINFMTKKIPYGTFDQGDQDSVTCRTIHIKLASISPDIHCPHVGKTGGGACTNKTSQSYYKNDNYMKCAYKRPE
ncbi:unnamed protein product [Didymodactylos carnosus]|uniref:Uncharacterized protein n=1 Tax=Didymodactylos carnosus TaxID=1234261 RepID=A0A814U9A5_9BILA|nr:unnamed protein product [Didymodactylos carnosus]CAF1171802.1 unnamed protein product [Didymodactylos carnosus]CAF3741977.1 unnamed protein product [Didymodactylos carnosus]CAF3935664.1 unnamed protein product [Didymodactylos carnosus]